MKGGESLSLLALPDLRVPDGLMTGIFTFIRVLGVCEPGICKDKEGVVGLEPEIFRMLRGAVSWITKGAGEGERGKLRGPVGLKEFEDVDMSAERKRLVECKSV